MGKEPQPKNGSRSAAPTQHEGPSVVSWLDCLQLSSQMRKNLGEPAYLKKRDSRSNTPAFKYKTGRLQWDRESGKQAGVEVRLKGSG